MWLFALACSSSAPPPGVPADAVRLTHDRAALRVDGDEVPWSSFAADPTEPVDGALVDALRPRAGRPLWIDLPRESELWALRRILGSAEEAGVGPVWVGVSPTEAFALSAAPRFALASCGAEPQAVKGVEPLVTLSLQTGPEGAWVVATASFVPVTASGPTDGLDARCLAVPPCEELFPEGPLRAACAEGAGPGSSGAPGAAGSTGSTTGSTGSAAGSTGSTTGSTGSTGPAAGSTGYAAGSTGSTTGSTGSTEPAAAGPAAADPAAVGPAAADPAAADPASADPAAAADPRAPDPERPAIPGRVTLGGAAGCFLPIARTPDEVARWRAELPAVLGELGLGDRALRVLMPEARTRADALLAVVGGFVDAGLPPPAIGTTILVEGNDGPPPCNAPVRDRNALAQAAARWLGSLRSAAGSQRTPDGG